MSFDLYLLYRRYPKWRLFFFDFDMEGANPFDAPLPAPKNRTRKCADFLLFHSSLFTFH